MKCDTCKHMVGVGDETLTCDAKLPFWAYFMLLRANNEVAVERALQREWAKKWEKQK